MIPVTQPYLPSIEEYQTYLAGIWDRNWLTNNGPLVKELEVGLCTKLKIDNALFVTNGTIAIQLAIKALNLKGEIITTPFSYVATTSSIVWEGCTPIFADIDEASFNIDPKKIEEAISPNTSSILATHVFGNPCDVFEIEKIARKHNLSVIYDAAHAFGVSVGGRSIFDYGDISTTSFHATKLFHTIEGGAVFTKNRSILSKLHLMRNFGHSSPSDFDGVGINAKNSEVHAAMGLVNLKYIEKILAQRKLQSQKYVELLSCNQIVFQKILAGTKYNHSYFPILLSDEYLTLQIIKSLNSKSIFPRRYFYPSLSKLDYIKQQETLVSDSISKRILCLPLYHDLSIQQIEKIASIILETINSES